RSGGGRVALHEIMKLIGRFISESLKAVELVLKMQIERAGADTRRLGNILRARVMIAALHKKPARSIHQLAPALQLALRPAAQACSLPRLRGQVCRFISLCVQNVRFSGFSVSGTRFLDLHGGSVRFE